MFIKKDKPKYVWKNKPTSPDTEETTEATSEAKPSSEKVENEKNTTVKQTAVQHRKPTKSSSKTKRRPYKRKSAPRKSNKQGYKTKSTFGMAGIYAGIATFISGTANACRAIPANPLLLGIGAVVTIASLAYLVWNYLNQ